MKSITELRGLAEYQNVPSSYELLPPTYANPANGQPHFSTEEFDIEALIIEELDIESFDMEEFGNTKSRIQGTIQDGAPSVQEPRDEDNDNERFNLNDSSSEPIGCATTRRATGVKQD